jgi:hypothetical protein
MNLTAKKWLLRPFLFLLATLTIILGIGLVLLTTQQQRLVESALSELNDQFRGELVVSKSNISLFENFPYVSIALHDVKFYDDKSKINPPIYEIGHLYAGFNISDLYHQRYNVRQLTLTDGFVKLVQSREGLLNLLVAKNLAGDTSPATSSDNSAEATVSLEKIILKNIDLSFLDQQSGHRYHSQIEELTAYFVLYHRQSSAIDKS